MTVTPPVEAAPAPERRSIDYSKVPYQLPQPTGMLADTLVASALDLSGDERLWVPQAKDVSFKPLLLNVSQGYFINLIRVRASGVVSRHRHAGPVHAFTLRGKWHYLEHDWIASAGDYSFEPPGETHTLVVPEDVAEMVTLFHVTSGYTYVDPHGVALGYEDSFTKLEQVSRHYKKVGIGDEYIRRMVR
ncbi:2,4'-dihydroxyacetophenone dioxygenase family protein [Bradyrhizobium pachyrhizi]|uniref:2,4'-dihydroxyacetophenone dioxygenase family protein n=1 Tax=Bradyrhizobium pachyrhizi TaxID=280333 RepID=UPI003D15F811